MIKKILTFVLLFCGVFFCNADNLVIIRIDDSAQVDNFIRNNEVAVHYFNDDFIIATVSDLYSGSYEIVDNNAWTDDSNYYLLWAENARDYVAEANINGDVVFLGDDFLIVRLNADNDLTYNKINHLGVVAINNNEVKELLYPASKSLTAPITSNDSLFISQLLEQVSQDSLQLTVQHLQNYGSRRCYEESTVEAQEWIADYYRNHGYEVIYQDVREYPTKNVIIAKTGTLYPDEYVVCGAHYDSYSYYGNAPGADDNATGTAGVMEIARILSNYDFERSIVICSFAAEEVGLVGSDVFASKCHLNNINIVGYFNIDMSGYLAPGAELHTTVIFPNKAQQLYDFYISTCEMFIPDFQVSRGFLSGGDSDHTSFNRNGYIGIYPFENTDNYCPYIHTDADTIGLAVNNFELCTTFTKACLANVVRLANNGISPDAISEYNEVSVYPNPVDNFLHISSSLIDDCTIIDAHGNIVRNFNISQPDSKIFVGDLPSGLYILNFSNKNKSLKFIKQ